MSDVSVVIPHWNREDLLERVLVSLTAQTDPPREVLVVDNGSTDGSARCANRHGARFIELGSNLGFSRAVNEGWKIAKSRWVLVLNNDVLLEPGFLAALCDAAEARGAWFAVPCLLDARNTARLDGTFDLICRGATAWRAGHGEALQGRWLHDAPAWFPPLTAALVRRDLFAQVGGLDERFGSYLEDVDFGLRCVLAGFDGAYVPAARATHLGSATLGEWNPRKVRLISRNQVLLVAKHYPDWWILSYGWPVLVAQLLWGLVALRHGAGVAWLRGKFDAIRHYRQARRGRIPADPEKLPVLLSQSERQIRSLLPEKPGAYWKTYFRLAGRERDVR